MISVLCKHNLFSRRLGIQEVDADVLPRNQLGEANCLETVLGDPTMVIMGAFL